MAKPAKESTKSSPKAISKTTTTTPTGTTRKALSKHPLSAEFIVDSSESDAEQAAQISAPTPATTEEIAKSAGNDSEKESDQASDDGEASEAEEDDKVSEQDESTNVPNEVQEIENTTNIGVYSTTENNRPAPPFIPPVNFFQAKCGSDAISVSKKFNKNALHNLELWYITVPAGLPVDQLNQLSWNSINAGDSVLDHNGSSHGFFLADQECSVKIIAPKAKGYAPVSAAIDRTLHLREVSRISTPNIPKSVPAPPKPWHKQPKGLRMRWKPTGTEPYYQPGTLGDSESETEPADQTSAIIAQSESSPAGKVPKEKAKTSEKAKKRKREEDVAEGVLGKKSKILDGTITTSKTSHRKANSGSVHKKKDSSSANQQGLSKQNSQQDTGMDDVASKSSSALAANPIASKGIVGEKHTNSTGDVVNDKERKRELKKKAKKAKKELLERDQVHKGEEEKAETTNISVVKIEKVPTEPKGIEKPLTMSNATSNDKSQKLDRSEKREKEKRKENREKKDSQGTDKVKEVDEKKRKEKKKRKEEKKKIKAEKAAVS